MEHHERRRAPRAAVELPVRYRREGGEERGATLADISSAGVRLVGGEAFPAGTRIEIAFTDPRGRRHALAGTVVRSAPAGGFAVSLVEIDPPTLDFIRELLAAR